MAQTDRNTASTPIRKKALRFWDLARLVVAALASVPLQFPGSADDLVRVVDCHYRALEGMSEPFVEVFDVQSVFFKQMVNVGDEFFVFVAETRHPRIVPELHLGRRRT